MHYVITHLQEAAENWKLHLSILNIEVATDGTSYNITKAAHYMSLETRFSNGLAPSWVAEKSREHLQEIL
jgi:hypothetical protein